MGIDRMLNRLTINGAVRALLLLFAFNLPILYDLSVPEVSGDIRWAATHLVAGFAALALLIHAMLEKRSTLPRRTAWIYVFGMLLAIWAAVSMVDSINVYRGIAMIKAIYAQLLLIPVAAYVWKPGFARRLTWALALPVAFCSLIGIAQFFAATDTGLAAQLGQWWPHPGFVVDKVLGYYQQSAVPGSSFANKNLAGSWTAMMLPLIVYLLVTSTSWLGRGSASILLALGTLFLLYSRARASWVAIVFGTLCLLAVLAFTPAWRNALWRQFGPSRWLWLAPTLLLVFYAGGAISPVTGAHSVRESVASNAGRLIKPTFDDVGGRIAYNLNSLAIIRDHWFNGIGLGAFHAIYPAYYNAIIVTPKNSYNVLARPQRSHTDLMQAFDEMGVPGGIFYVAVFLWGLWAAFWLRGHTASLGVWPMFAGWSLLTIYINALMDFPLQLPTAPADAMLLLGGLLWHWRQAYPNSGLQLPHVNGMNIGRGGVLVAAALVAVAQYAACWDSWHYREANQVLKQAMIRIFSNINDDETLKLIEQAHQIYPYDPRIHEHRAVVYANYGGKLPITLEQRIAVLEQELQEDPWGANHLVNVSGLYLQLAEINQQQGHPQAAAHALARVREIYARLLRVADFSHYTYGVGGMMELLAGNPRAAVPIFQRALVIEPNYPPARQGLERAQKLLSPSTPTSSK